MKKRGFIFKVVGIVALMLGVGISLCVISEQSKASVLVDVAYGAGMPEHFSNCRIARESGLKTFSEDDYFEDVKKNKTLKSDDEQKFTYKKSTCYLKTTESGEYGDFYCIYDKYFSEDKKEEVEYIHNTDIIAKYSNSRIDIENRENIISERDAKTIAESFVKENIAENALDDYTYMGTMDLLDQCYNFQYIRYIEGYATDDTIIICVRKSGELFVYKARNYGKYANIESEISKTELDIANSVLVEQLEEAELYNTQIIQTEITTNTSGDVYLGVTASYGEGSTGRIRLFTPVE